MSIKTVMTALADKIRELSGQTGTLSLDAMTSQVDAANEEVGTQADLLAQLITAVNDLPNAGSSEPATCEVTVTSNTSDYMIWCHHLGADGVADWRGVFGGQTATKTYSFTVPLGCPFALYVIAENAPNRAYPDMVGDVRYNAHETSGSFQHLLVWVASGESATISYPPTEA